MFIDGKRVVLVDEATPEPGTLSPKLQGLPGAVYAEDWQTLWNEVTARAFGSRHVLYADLTQTYESENGGWYVDCPEAIVEVAFVKKDKGGVLASWQALGHLPTGGSLVIGAGEFLLTMDGEPDDAAAIRQRQFRPGVSWNNKVDMERWSKWQQILGDFEALFDTQGGV